MDIEKTQRRSHNIPPTNSTKRPRQTQRNLKAKVLANASSNHRITRKGSSPSASCIHNKKNQPQIVRMTLEGSHRALLARSCVALASRMMNVACQPGIFVYYHIHLPTKPAKHPPDTSCDSTVEGNDTRSAAVQLSFC